MVFANNQIDDMMTSSGKASTSQIMEILLPMTLAIFLGELLHTGESENIRCERERARRSRHVIAGDIWSLQQRREELKIERLGMALLALHA